MRVPIIFMRIMSPAAIFKFYGETLILVGHVQVAHTSSSER